MYRVFLGLGSNLGNRIGFLNRAIREINDLAPVKASSSIYETEPLGMVSEHQFLNMVIEVETALRPPELFPPLKAIERKLGRRPGSHMMDREIDIDILLYDGISYSDEKLSVPHPQLEHRRFVLEPFKELAPFVVHPTRNQTIAALLRTCRDRSRVVRTEFAVDSIHVGS
ncbi:MAG TPA: 2-amino-4-hydroxy-6-hydroxymethyldihydropteridine diphosphokinase [Bacteroidota bacterium]|jgi:2-amino-4-hydroxy-6-hydroxymethyldihydropteridine diphosphokinase